MALLVLLVRILTPFSHQQRMCFSHPLFLLGLHPVDTNPKNSCLPQVAPLFTNWTFEQKNHNLLLTNPLHLTLIPVRTFKAYA